jgi:hypothetical protein
MSGDLSVFGGIVTPPDVESAFLATLRTWSPTYLRFIERHTARKPNDLPAIASWRAADTLEERFPEQAIPACQVMVATDIDLRTQADGMMGTFTGDIDILVSSPEPERARELALLYAFAHGLALLQHPELDGSLDVQGYGWEKMGAPAIGKGEGRWLALGTCHVTIAVQGIAVPLSGPTEPIVTEPAELPIVEHTELELTLGPS